MAQQADALLELVLKVPSSWMPQQAAHSAPSDASVAEQPLVSEELSPALQAWVPLVLPPPEVHLRAAQLARPSAPLVLARAFSARASQPRHLLLLRQAHGNACGLVPHAANRSSSSASSSL